MYYIVLFPPCHWWKKKRWYHFWTPKVRTGAEIVDLCTEQEAWDKYQIGANFLVHKW